jgi:hypothetical protein
VTPATTYPPELVKYAQQQLMAQRGAGNLKQSVEDVMPVYREILGGGDRRTMQGQALMDIAQAGLALASGRNAQGANIAGGSFASQLASAAQGLPGKLAERAGQFQQEERAIKLAALKSAESNVDSQRKLYAQIVKSAGQSPFGKSDWAYSILTNPELVKKYAEGTSTPQETMFFEAAQVKMSQPRTELYKDDKGFDVTRTSPGVTLPHVPVAMQQRAQRLGQAPRTTAAPVTTSAAPAAPTPYLGLSEDTTAELNPADVEAQRVAKEARATIGNVPSLTLSDIPPEQQAQATLALNKAVEPVEARQTLWEAHQDAIGLHRSIGRTLGQVIPFNVAGQLSTKVKQSAATIDLIRQQIVSSLRPNVSKLAEGEREEINNEFVRLGLKYFQNEADYRNQVIALARDIDSREKEAISIAKDPRVTAKERNDQGNRAAEMANIKRLIGAPVFIRTKADADKLAPNQEYLVYDQEVRGWVRKFNDKKN